MNHEYKSNLFDNEKYSASYLRGKMDKDDITTRKILLQEYTEYTGGANEIINRVQRQYLQNKRYSEIDKALDERDQARFLALTSDNWESVL
ncbi:IDEAL domain-containing protein [Peribacillus saganii]|uniref:IDEAL domain-containing protein n=1 Tax=Peribacillus saganii TaxID=2303992 RepID=A0A372LSQ7_9BACI|nr:IDEAL domain-containing protein [Peribacillus saganii]RFU71229.1 IDEAL domain-containing protein [Peribacillus saganii]